MFKKLKDEIPANIGVITYHGKSDDIVGRLRHSKSCVYQEEVNQELYNSLLHTFLNKKDKQVKKLKITARSELDAQYTRAVKVVDDLVARLALEIEHKRCYNIGWDYCVNAVEHDQECQSCPHNFRFKSDLHKKIEGDRNDKYSLLR